MSDLYDFLPDLLGAENGAGGRMVETDFLLIEQDERDFHTLQAANSQLFILGYLTVWAWCDCTPQWLMLEFVH